MNSSQPIPSIEKAAAKLSQIEQMPTDLLEMIFFNCLNLNLPRASPIIGRALSSFYVKRRLAEIAFGSRSMKRPLHAGTHMIGILNSNHVRDILGIPKSRVQGLRSESLNSPWIIEKEVLDQRKWRGPLGLFQSEVLKSPWMTLDFWRQYMVSYLGKMLPVILRENNLSWLDNTPADRITKAMVAERVELLTKSKYFKMHNACLAMVFEASSKCVVSPRTEMFRSRFEKMPMIRCLPHCQIPAKILQGPWTEERCQFLELLVSAGARVEVSWWRNAEVRKAARRGFVDALKEGNRRVLIALLGLSTIRPPYTYGRWPRSRDRWDGTCGIWSQRRGEWIVPGPAHLAYAVTHLGCDRWVVELLMPFRKDWIGWEDATLKKWAKQKQEEGDARGSWLFDLLAKYPATPLSPGQACVYEPPTEDEPACPAGWFRLCSPGIELTSWLAEIEKIEEELLYPGSTSSENGDG